MSTNYYARIVPSKVKREMLKQLIDAGDFNGILNEVSSMYDSFRVDYTGETHGGQIHLGKRSCGWKFLWNPNTYIVHHGLDSSTVYQVYPLTKEGIKSFINREDVVIVDEYNQKQNKEKFWEMALTWEQDGWDDASYDKFEKERDSDHNPWPVTGELIDYFRQQGYEFTNFTNSDFYSDGLRFATYTDFC